MNTPEQPPPSTLRTVLSDRKPQIVEPRSFSHLHDKEAYSTGMGDHTHRALRPGANDHLKYKSRGM